MDKEHIKQLADQLLAIGIADTSFDIARNICFGRANFILTRNIQYDRELLAVQFYFERLQGESRYKVLYYDAVLEKQNEGIEEIINEINLMQLEKSFAGINWKIVFGTHTTEQADEKEKNILDIIDRVEQVLDCIKELEKSQAGKVAADTLKMKYWSSVHGFDSFVPVSTKKNKPEIAQRFYISGELPSISIAEAFRFLQYRKLEKLLIEKQKIKNSNESTVMQIQPTVSAKNLKKGNFKKTTTIQKNN